MISTNPVGQAAGETVREIIRGETPLRHDAHTNLSDTERNISIAAGAAIGLIGLVKGNALIRAASIGLAGALINRGISGYCALYNKMGIDTRHR